MVSCGSGNFFYQNPRPRLFESSNSHACTHAHTTDRLILSAVDGKKTTVNDRHPTLETLIRERRTN